MIGLGYPAPSLCQQRWFDPGGVAGRPPEVSVIATCGRLDELGEYPADQSEVVMVASSLGGGKRILVSAKSVVQHRLRELGPGNRSALAPSSRAWMLGSVSSSVRASSPRAAESTGET